MKNIFIALLFVFSFKAMAYNGFRCVPSAKDTRFQVLQKEDKIEVLVTNPMGYEFMPQFDSPISFFNLDFYKMQGEDLQGLGNSFSYSWDIKDCTMEASNFTVQCSGEVKNPTTEIGSFGISTTEVIEKFQVAVSEKRKFRMTVERFNIYFVSFSFDRNNCEVFN